MNGIEKLIAALREAGLISHEAEVKLAGEDIADLLWFLLYVHQKQGTQAIEPTPDDGPHVPTDPPPVPFSQNDDEKVVEPLRPEKEKKPDLERETTRHIYLPSQRLDEQGGQGGFPFRSPAASALPQSLDLARALRPLMRRIPSRTNFLLDEPATAQRIAESQKSIWSPMLRPAPMRWLEIALVVDVGVSMVPWRQTIDELRILLEHHGAFRDVRVWRLATDDRDHASLYAGTDTNTRQEREPGELIDPSGRRLILVVSDAVSPAWQSGRVQELLDLWGQNNVVTLVQVFPKRLWSRTTLSNADIVDVHATALNKGNAGLIIRGEQMEFDEEIEASLPIPIVTLEPTVIANWARMIAGAENAWTLGAIFYQNLPALPEESPFVQKRPTSPRDLVRQFRATASPMASKLISLLSAAPISFPVIRLVQQAVLPQANQVHIAEIFLSGLLKEISRDQQTNDPDSVEYDFLPGVREVLHESIPIPSEFEVIEAVSAFLGSRYGHLRDFYALADAPSTSSEIHIGTESRPFAHIIASAWRHLGGIYDAMADNLEQYVELEAERDLHAESGEGVKVVEAVVEEVNTVDEVVEIAEVAAREKTSFELVAEQLEQTGWLVQNFDAMNLNQAQGIAVRHEPAFPDDYILYIDREGVGVIKVRPIGEPLAGVEEPLSLRELKLTSNRPKRRDTLIMTMFVYESTGKETQFSSYIEPEPRSRSVFTFHRPETLALWISQASPDKIAGQNDLLRSRLRRMPALSNDGLREHQFEAIRELESSLASNHKHTLLHMIVNTGMTYTAVHSIYRLLKYGGARRILYLFESSQAVNYTLSMIEGFIPPESEISFADLYHVHNLRRGMPTQDAAVCIGTFYQFYRLYHRGEAPGATLAHMRYNPALPIESFDIIFVGNCTSSDYQRWRPLIEYFDAFIIGIGYKIDGRLRGMFDNNVVYEQMRRLPRALILTTLPIEYRVAQQYFDLETTKRLTDAPFERGLFAAKTGLWDVMIAKVDAQTVEVPSGIARVIDDFSPLVILSVGIADGMKDVQPGDVVVATKVYEYQFNRERRISPIGDGITLPGNKLMQEAQIGSTSDNWLKRLKRRLPLPLPRVHFASIVVGNKATKAQAHSFAQATYDDAVALESHSFLDGLVGSRRFLTTSLTSVLGGLEILIIRGISNLPDKSKERDSQRFEEIAAQNADAFAFEVLAQLNPAEFARDDSGDREGEGQEIDAEKTAGEDDGEYDDESSQQPLM